MKIAYTILMTAFALFMCREVLNELIDIKFHLKIQTMEIKTIRNCVWESYLKAEERRQKGEG